MESAENPVWMGAGFFHDILADDSPGYIKWHASRPGNAVVIYKRIY